MTPKQILDSFSETLMQDERILSAQERALLRNLIHHARSASLETEVHEAVNATIASAVGETVAQRAFSVLGASIVERILGNAAANSTGFPGNAAHPVELSTPPQPQPPRPPAPAPGPPGRPRPEDAPMPPSPAPGPPGISAIKHPMPSRTAVLERPDVARASCVVLDEFLAPQELQELTQFTLAHESDFRTSEVVGRDAMQGGIDEEHRRSRVLTDLGKYQDLILSRIQLALPLALSRLNMDEFPITNAETQITASNDGDFFKCHADNGHHNTASRQLTFVYFFHREPRQFNGGELRLHDSLGGFQSIVPEQNQIVFFPCSTTHEITPVDCPSGLFADSRFTLNGWLHK
jgi:Rps23 Pro-64 3,4-dihydroxylase Tpa1-like proline 4-hydroxylase